MDHLPPAPPRFPVVGRSAGEARRAMNALAREAALLPLPGTLDLKVREGRVEALWEFWDAYAVRLPKEAFTREGQRLLREFSGLAALPRVRPGAGPRGGDRPLPRARGGGARAHGLPGGAPPPLP